MHGLADYSDIRFIGIAVDVVNIGLSKTFIFKKKYNAEKDVWGGSFVIITFSIDTGQSLLSAWL